MRRHLLMALLLDAELLARRLLGQRLPQLLLLLGQRLLRRRLPQLLLLLGQRLLRRRLPQLLLLLRRVFLLLRKKEVVPKNDASTVGVPIKSNLRLHRHNLFI
jgi:hypothetical protein